jgi:hypothetical protein
VYVISKQLIIGVFRVCVDGYVKELKGQVSKSLVVQALQNCRLAPINLDLPYFAKYCAIIFVIY